MPTYRLYYFTFRGRSEGARWLFAQAGVPYEYIQFSREEFAKRKHEFPFGQLPVLEVADDTGKTTQLAQSNAIDRFLAREFGLAGKTSLDVARGDMLGEHFTEILSKLPLLEKDPEKKKQLMRETILNGPVGEGLKLFEKFVQDNGYFVGDGVTRADLGFTAGTEWLYRDCPNALDATPKLKQLSERVKALPRIAEFIAKR